MDKTRGLLTFLFDYEYLIVDLLAEQHRVKIVKQRLKVFRSVAKRDDDGHTMPGYAIRRATFATWLHLGERLLHRRQLWRRLDDGQWANCKLLYKNGLFMPLIYIIHTIYNYYVYYTYYVYYN